MTLLAHAIGSATAPAPATEGLRGQPLRRITAADLPDLGLWATGWKGSSGPLGRDDAFGHHAIVAAIAATGPCLPIRFGSWLADDADAAALLTGRRVALRAALARVTDRSELAVTLLWSEAAVAPGRGHAVATASPDAMSPPGPTMTPGRRFLEGRRDDFAVTEGRREQAESLAAGLIQLLEGLGIEPADVRHQTCPTAEVALSLSALVPTATATATKAAAGRLVGGLDGVRGVVSGPWPPYSFTTEIG